MTTATELDQAFHRDERIRVIDRDGHSIIAVRTPTASADIALQGAQILSWTPAGAGDVLWCAPLPKAGSAKAIRGGIPICWPWFGPHATDSSQPQHGLVRTAVWTLLDTAVTEGGARISLVHAAWGCDLRLDFDIGQCLSLTLSTTNVGASAVALTEALHTYFRVGDVAAVAVTGLDGLSYRDNADGGRQKSQCGAMRLPSETVALFPDAPDDAEISDPTLQRRIRIARSGGRSTVVWHPGASVASFTDIPAAMATGFVCVESGTIAPQVVTIAPGGTHQLSVSYGVDGLCVPSAEGAQLPEAARGGEHAERQDDQRREHRQRLRPPFEA